MTLVVITGLAAEARIAAAANVIIGAGREAALAASIERAIALGARRLISFGVAGALAPQLRPGDVLVARSLIDGAERVTCDEAWSAAIFARLQRDSRNARPLIAPGEAGLDILGVAQPVADPAAKAELYARTGAAAVDMESAVVARAARRHGLPFAILRVILDPAERALPPAALAPPRDDGAVDLAATLRALALNPAQIPALIGLALDARLAFRALADARARLGPDFARVDLGEL